MCGPKKVTQTTEIPPPTPEELEQLEFFNAITEASLIQQGFQVNRTSKNEYKKQGEIDALEAKLRGLQQQQSNQNQKDGFRGRDPRRGFNNNREVQDIQRQIEGLKKEGMQDRTSVSIIETPEAKARREKKEQQLDVVEDNFYKAVNKLTTGDFSVTPKQKADINNIIKSAGFDGVINELKIQFSSAEGAVNKAVDALVASGKADLAEASRVQRNQLKQEAELLGRSFSDSDMQTRQQEFEQGAIERLYRGASAEAAQRIGDLRQTRAVAIGGVKEQEALARLNLLNSAAQPVLALQAGGTFSQLRGALGAQAVSNQLATGNLVGTQLNRYLQERMAQPTSTQKTSTSILDTIGSIVGLGAAGASAAFGGISAFRR